MRISLEVDNESVTTEGAATALGAEATGDNGDTPLSSPATGDTGGAGESEQAPEAGEGGKADTPAGELEKVKGYKLPDEKQATEMSVAADEQLRDIGEASFGPASRSRHRRGRPGADPDDRGRTRGACTASLLITARDGSQWIGTGWFIGPHTLVTAGHCVFIKNSGVAGRDGWVQSIQVMPGPQRRYAAVRLGHQHRTSAPSPGGPTRRTTSTTTAPSCCRRTLANTTGWLGIGAYSDATLPASTANISGYPGDKPGGHAVVPRAPGDVGRCAQGLLRRRHARRAERQRRLPHRQRCAVRRGRPRVRRSHVQLRHPDHVRGVQQPGGVEGLSPRVTDQTTPGLPRSPGRPG